MIYIVGALARLQDILPMWLLLLRGYKMILLQRNRAFSTERFFLSPNSSARVMSLRNYSLTTNIFRIAVDNETGSKLEMQDFFYLFCMEVLHLNIE